MIGGAEQPAAPLDFVGPRPYPGMACRLDLSL